MDEKTLKVIKWAGAIVMIAGFVGYFTIHPVLGVAIMIVGMICTLIGIFVPASEEAGQYHSIEETDEINDAEIATEADPNEDNVVNAEEAETEEKE